MKSGLIRAAWLCLAAFTWGPTSGALANTAADAFFPDGTILPPALNLPSQPLFPETDIPGNLSNTVMPLGSASARSFRRTITIARPVAPRVIPTAAQNAASRRAASEVSSRRVRAQMTLTLRSTGYNSLRSQTDRTPHITATGARTRFGIVALSRDLLRLIPYGSQITIRDLGTWSGGRGVGRYNKMLQGMVFVVEDTMHPRKSGTLDVWFPARRQAIQWGVRRIQITVIRRGR